MRSELRSKNLELRAKTLELMTVSEIFPTLRKVRCSEESLAVAKERCYRLLFNSQRHIAVARSLGTVLGYDQTDPAYLEG